MQEQWLKQKLGKIPIVALLALNRWAWVKRGWALYPRELCFLKMHLVVWKPLQSLALAEVVSLRPSVCWPVKVRKFAWGAWTYASSTALLSSLLSLPAQQPFWARTGASTQTWWAAWVKCWFFTSWGVKIQQDFTLRTLRSTFILWNLLFLQMKILLRVNASYYCHDISIVLKNWTENYWKSGVMCLLWLP